MREEEGRREREEEGGGRGRRRREEEEGGGRGVCVHIEFCSSYLFLKCFLDFFVRTLVALRSFFASISWRTSCSGGSCAPSPLTTLPVPLMAELDELPSTPLLPSVPRFFFKDCLFTFLYVIIRRWIRQERQCNTGIYRVRVSILSWVSMYILKFLQ